MVITYHLVTSPGGVFLCLLEYDQDEGCMKEVTTKKIDCNEILI